MGGYADALRRTLLSTCSRVECLAILTNIAKDKKGVKTKKGERNEDARGYTSSPVARVSLKGIQETRGARELQNGVV